LLTVLDVTHYNKIAIFFTVLVVTHYKTNPSYIFYSIRRNKYKTKIAIFFTVLAVTHYKKKKQL